MEQNSIIELEDELNRIDVESIRLDAVIQLKTWQKKMHSLIDKTYKNRLHELDSITSNVENEIKEQQNRLNTLQVNDQNTLREIKHEVHLLKANLTVHESIPENFDQRIERTIYITQNEDDSELIEDDDEPVIVDMDRHEVRAGNHIVTVPGAPQQITAIQQQGTVSKIVSSAPVQHAIALTLARALTNVGTVAATTTTTVAVTTMAKTAVIATACGIGTVAYGVGKIAVGTTRKALSWIFSSEE